LGANTSESTRQSSKVHEQLGSGGFLPIELIWSDWLGFESFKQSFSPSACFSAHSRVRQKHFAVAQGGLYFGSLATSSRGGPRQQLTAEVGLSPAALTWWFPESGSFCGFIKRRTSEPSSWAVGSSPIMVRLWFEISLGSKPWRAKTIGAGDCSIEDEQCQTCGSDKSLLSCWIKERFDSTSCIYTGDIRVSISSAFIAKQFRLNTYGSSVSPVSDLLNLVAYRSDDVETINVLVEIVRLGKRGRGRIISPTDTPYPKRHRRLVCHVISLADSLMMSHVQCRLAPPVSRTQICKQVWLPVR